MTGGVRAIVLDQTAHHFANATALQQILLVPVANVHAPTDNTKPSMVSLIR